MIALAIVAARWCADWSGKVGRIMDIILHVGAHRSGTTTLQQFLNRNAGVLRGAGVEVWTPDRTRAGMFAGLIQRPQDITEQIERRGARSCGVIALEMARLASDNRRQLLVSEENMIGAIRNNLREGRLYPLLDERLLRFRAGFGGQVRRIGLSVRSYETYWASCLSYGVAQGVPVPDADRLDRLVTQPRRWRDVIRDVTQVFPDAEIVVWPFERFAGQPDAQLAMLTGGTHVRMPLTGTRDWVNASPRRDKLRTILNLRGEAETAQALPPGEGRWMPFDQAQQDALRAQYLADLAWLRQGASGLARLIDIPDAAASDMRPTEDNKNNTLTYDMDEEGRGVPAMSGPRALAEGGRKFGKQDIMV